MIAGAAYRAALERTPKNAGPFFDSDTITKKDAGEIAVTVFARIISFYAVRG